MLAVRRAQTQYQRFIYDAYPDVADLVKAAERRVSEFGGSDFRLQGGCAFKRFPLLWLEIRQALSVGLAKLRMLATAAPR